MQVATGDACCFQISLDEVFLNGYLDEWNGFKPAHQKFEQKVLIVSSLLLVFYPDLLQNLSLENASSPPRHDQETADATTDAIQSHFIVHTDRNTTPPTQHHGNHGSSTTHWCRTQRCLSTPSSHSRQQESHTSGTTGVTETTRTTWPYRRC